MAVGLAILVIAFHLLKRKATYRDLGHDYFDRRNADAVRRSLLKRLQNLGHTVNLAPAPVFSWEYLPKLGSGGEARNRVLANQRMAAALQTRGDKFQQV
jgi:hypothetical protein